MTTKEEFTHFMASPAGRGLRVVAGLGLIARGVRGGGAGWAVLGAVPLLAGAFDVCLLGPVLGEPFRGKDVRRE
ncbi:DUF2892 domain-containing protein [Deinococcus aluminii]|uniref:Inner membrane protein YgaP-like transmembrane domain-containing protein n=1 Tax=Deinococcus aluminii TaxID=1656885 RepID=A0ABP9XF76_9DEIO